MCRPIPGLVPVMIFCSANGWAETKTFSMMGMPNNYARARAFRFLGDEK